MVIKKFEPRLSQKIISCTIINKLSILSDENAFQIGRQNKKYFDFGHW